MVYCSICGSFRNKYNKPRSFHRFPKNLEVRMQWLKALNRSNWMPKSHDRICSDHFKEEYFYRLGAKVELLKGAVPNFYKSSSNKKDVKINANLYDYETVVISTESPQIDYEDSITNVTSNIKIEPIEVNNDENKCRICLQFGQLLLDKSLCEKFQKITNITIDLSDTFPKFICFKCVERLEIAYLFVEEAVSTNNLLNETFKLDHNYANILNFDLKQEINETIEEPKTKSWKCQICECHFKTRGLLQLHRKNHRIKCQKHCMTFKTFKMFKKHKNRMEFKQEINMANKRISKCKMAICSIDQSFKEMEIATKLSVQKGKNCEISTDIFKSDILSNLRKKTHEFCAEYLKSNFNIKTEIL